ncbi:ABC transporter permease [Saccharolobus solfataricus]|uniref:Maltose ABC transporter, permease n=3 Tax=Saccharolobus solfataricus TaxID=2287 RepID=Q97UG4_SACS2|nr:MULTISPECIES: ABC transporter permease [Sulfolobaceae]AAK43157.1 Maltose ABC transporter, permease [Saccharolobus solfataricus P2]AKA73196.1 ABC transporter permease [Saccharolobus solfataricus]AKA75896.1 ABC transporter permease [Saccharolobus solfataricus]AKA78588.1 ABC transporter permease [Saccharolobus solfataricus]AZF67664.1 ABC transporter permease [Saccharolobus solfataricus]
MATFFVVITVNFILPRLMPGSALAVVISLIEGQNGVAATAGSSAIALEVSQLEAAFGLTPAPWYVQYAHYIQGIFTLNLGASITYYPTPVLSIILSGLPWTLFLVVVGAIIAFFLGSYLGSIAGFNRRSRKDLVILIITSILAALPSFVILMYLEMWLSVQHGIFLISFPSKINTSPNSIMALSRFYTLPIIALMFTSLSGFVLGMRNNMLHTIRDNYVTYAEILGLDHNRIRKMVYKNSLLPNITAFAIILGLAISQSLTVEGLLTTPGVGFFFGLALTSKDLPLLQGIFLFIAIMLILSIAIVEAIYTILDPRARVSESE